MSILVRVLALLVAGAPLLQASAEETTTVSSLEKQPPVGPVKPGVRNPHTPGGIPILPPGMGAAAGLSSRESMPAATGRAPLSITPTGLLSYLNDKNAVPPDETVDPAKRPSGTGILSGTCLHRPAGALSPGELSVRVLALNARAVVGEWKAPVEADGTFQVSGLSTDPSVKYHASTVYQGVAYLSEGQSFESGKSQLSLDIPVFEVIPRSDALTLDNLHIVLQPAPLTGNTGVSQVMFFTNPTEQTMTGAQNTSVTFQLELPPGATQIHGAGGLMPSQIVAHQDRLLYRGPIYPGKFQAILKYQVNSSAPWTYRQTLPVAAKAVEIFVPEGGLAVSSPLLTASAAPELQGKKFKRYSGGPFLAGQVLTFEVGGQGASAAGATGLGASGLDFAKLESGSLGAPEPSSPFPGWPVAAVMTVGLLFYIGWPLSRKKQQGMPSAPEPVSVQDPVHLQVADLVRERERLLESVRELDFDLESGKLDAADHQRLREDTRERAIQVMQTLEALSAQAASLPAASLPAASLPAALPPLREEPAASAPESIATPVPSAGLGALPLKFCTHCGFKLEPIDRFCGSCGARLRGVSP